MKLHTLFCRSRLLWAVFIKTRVQAALIFFLKLKRNFCYLSFLSVIFLSSFSVLTDESTTEAGAVCTVDCPSSLLSSGNQELFSQVLSSCPQFLIERFKNKDQRSMWISNISADKECSKVKGADFKSAKNFENYLKRKEPFSKLSPPLAVSNCLSGLSEDQRQSFLADYYNSSYRLESGLNQSLQNISSIDSLLGNEPLKNTDCEKIKLSKTVFHRCRKLKTCSNSDGGKALHKTAEDTLLALKGIRAIDKELKTLRNSQERRKRARRGKKLSSKTQDELKKKIKDLEDRKRDLQGLYPWVMGKKFKDQYKENKDYTKEEIAQLVRTQLSHTREKLTDVLKETRQVYACVVHNTECKDINEKKINVSLAKTPPLDKENIFGKKDKIKALSSKELAQLSAVQKRELKQDAIASGYFEEAQCREKIREDVSYVRKELGLFALDVGLTIATVGLAGAAITGKLAVKMGSKLAPNMTKAQRMKNLGLIAVDAGYSGLYAGEVLDQCGEDINKLESLATGEAKTNTLCENQQSRVKHTSDLRSCILMASLVSLPIALPAAGLGVRAVLKTKSTLPKYEVKITDQELSPAGSSPKKIQPNSAGGIREKVKKNKKRLLSAYNSILNPLPADEQGVVMEAILGMELKKMSSQNISEKVRRALRSCTVK